MKRNFGIFLIVALLSSLLAVSSAQDINPLVGTWLWTSFSGGDGTQIIVDAPANYTLTFTEDGNVNVVADCNTVNGIYTVGGSSLEIFLGPSTGAFCGEASLSDQYISYLNQVVSYVISDSGTLSLGLMADGGIMGMSPVQPTLPVVPSETPVPPTAIPPTEAPTATPVPPTPVPTEEPTRIPAPFLGTWYWNNFTGGDSSVVVPNNPADYSITFTNDGVSVVADCNTGQGTYSYDNVSLSISVNTMTRAACPEGSLSEAFVNYLNQTASYTFAADGSLNLALVADAGIMKLTLTAPVPPPPFTGLWYWVDFRGSDDSVITVTNPASYTVNFGEDGSVAVQADCLNATGSYTANGNSLMIAMGPMTAIACDEGSLANVFVDYLANVASYVYTEDTTLYLSLTMDTGTLMLSRTVPEMIEDANPLETTWYWSKFASETTNAVIATPDLYTVSFYADGTVMIKADCNSAQGTYNVEGTLLKIAVGPMTMAACDEESRSNEFVNLLGQSDVFAIEDGTLTLALELGAGEMTLIDSSQLIQGSWQWAGSQSMDDSQVIVDEPRNYTVNFADDGTVSVKADCNNAMGEYTINGSAIDIELGPMTMAMCPEGSLSDSFVASLNDAVSVVFEGGNIYLALPMDGNILELNPSLVGTTWQWLETVTPVETIEVDQPQQYTVVFNDDGTANIKADCNNANADYTTTGGSISITVGPMTMAACPEGSLSNTFVEQIGAAGVYFFDNGYLYVDLFADSGTMKFIDESKRAIESVVGTWQLTDYRQANVTSAVNDPSLYVVTFNPDGTVDVTSDCKVTNGTYTADNGDIAVELGPTTMEICPDEGSLGDLFLSWLGSVVTYDFEMDRLKLELNPEIDGTLWLKSAS